MKYTIHCAFLIGMLLLYGCAPLAVPAVTPAVLPTARVKTGTIRVGFSSNTDVGDVPSLMAHEALTGQGYTIQVTLFAGADLQAAALSQGGIDIANGSMRTMWIALSKEPFAYTVMEQIADNWVLVAKPEFKTCVDLKGKRIAFTNTSSLNYALSAVYIQEHCPDLEFEQLFISSSENRAAALLAGELEATPLELADWIRVQNQAPDQFHALVNFAQELPALKTTGVYVNRAFAEQHPEAVRDYIRALLTVHRRIQANPSALQNAIVKYLALDPTIAQTIANAYLAFNMWDRNGGLERADVQYSIDFFTKSKSIPEGLTVDDVADLSYLNAVLGEIGRK